MGNGQFGFYLVGSSPSNNNSGIFTSESRSTTREYDRVLYKVSPSRFPRSAESFAVTPSNATQPFTSVTRAAAGEVGPLLTGPTGFRQRVFYSSTFPHKHDSKSNLIGNKGATSYSNGCSDFPRTRNLGQKYNAYYRHQDDFQLNYMGENVVTWPNTAKKKDTCTPPASALMKTAAKTNCCGNKSRNNNNVAVHTSYIRPQKVKTTECGVPDTNYNVPPGSRVQLNPEFRYAKGSQTDPSPWILYENLHNGKFMAVTKNTQKTISDPGMKKSSPKSFSPNHKENPVNSMPNPGGSDYGLAQGEPKFKDMKNQDIDVGNHIPEAKNEVPLQQTNYPGGNYEPNLGLGKSPGIQSNNTHPLAANTDSSEFPGKASSRKTAETGDGSDNDPTTEVSNGHSPGMKTRKQSNNEPENISSSTKLLFNKLGNKPGGNKSNTSLSRISIDLPARMQNNARGYGRPEYAANLVPNKKYSFSKTGNKPGGIPVSFTGLPEAPMEVQNQNTQKTHSDSVTNPAPNKKPTASPGMGKRQSSFKNLNSKRSSKTIQPRPSIPEVPQIKTKPKWNTPWNSRSNISQNPSTTHANSHHNPHASIKAPRKKQEHHEERTSIFDSEPPNVPYAGGGNLLGSFPSATARLIPDVHYNNKHPHADNHEGSGGKPKRYPSQHGSIEGPLLMANRHTIHKLKRSLSQAPRGKPTSPSLKGNKSYQEISNTRPPERDNAPITIPSNLSLRRLLEGKVTTIPHSQTKAERQLNQDVLTQRLSNPKNRKTDHDQKELPESRSALQSVLKKKSSQEPRPTNDSRGLNKTESERKSKIRFKDIPPTP